MTIATTEHPAQVVPAAGSPGANLIREAAAVMVDAHQLAKAVCSTQMVPKHFQGRPGECAAAMLYGASLGFDPMQSVRQIYVVHGQAALYARAMDALVKGNGHETWTVATSDDSVTVAGRRKGSDHIEESTWDFERAKKAGYTSNEKYRTDPQAMLYSKALSEVCRKIAPDVLNGVYSVEEMQMERVVLVEQVPTRGLAAVLAPETSPPDVAPDEAPAGASVEPPVSSGGEPPFVPLTDAQLKKIGTCMSKLGITDRDEALVYVSVTIGREVESRNDLSKGEANTLINRLEEELAAVQDGEVVS